MEFLHQRIPENLASKSFQTEFVGKTSAIDSIRDITMREKLYQQYKEVAELAKANMMTLSIETAEGQMRQYQKQFNTEMDQMWHNEKIVPSDQRLSPRMIHLMEQRLSNIDKRLACIYKYKAQLSKIQTKIP